jgi:PTS system nitrogen regulatory IIA component
MPIIDLLTSERVLHDLNVASKKRTLDEISTIISNSSDTIEHDDIFSGLIDRERLGSTGIGEGVAIPHCRLDNLETAMGIFIKLNNAVDFDAIDKQPVDLIFALVVPSHCCDEHLNTLAALAELFSSESNRNQLRNCDCPTSLYQKLAELT